MSREKLEDAVCAHQDWLETINAMNKVKFKRMKMLNSVNRAIKVSHEKRSLVYAEVHDAFAK